MGEHMSNEEAEAAKKEGFDTGETGDDDKQGKTPTIPSAGDPGAAMKHNPAQVGRKASGFDDTPSNK